MFVYGSMLDPQSLAGTVGLAPEQCRAADALLLDHERVWGIHIPLIRGTEADEERVNGVFLDVVPAPGRYVLGGLVSLADQAVTALVARERQYDLVDVTASAWPAAAASLGQVVTFASQPEFRTAAGPPSLVPARYRAFVATAVRARGADYAARFAATTARSAFGEFEGPYRFVDPAQAASVASAGPNADESPS